LLASGLALAGCAGFNQYVHDINQSIHDARVLAFGKDGLFQAEGDLNCSRLKVTDLTPDGVVSYIDCEVAVEGCGRRAVYTRGFSPQWFLEQESLHDTGGQL
jgi:hypothetical protein